MERIYGGKDSWNRWVLSLEWKREEVMDGVMVVTDDERGWQNVTGRLFQIQGDVSFRVCDSVCLSARTKTAGSSSYSS